MLAGGIIFIVLVQHRLRNTDVSLPLAFGFEAGKLLFATALWVWLVIDAAVGPLSRDNPDYRPARILRAWLCLIVVL